MVLAGDDCGIRRSSSAATSSAGMITAVGCALSLRSTGDLPGAAHTLSAPTRTARLPSDASVRRSSCHCGHRLELPRRPPHGWRRDTASAVGCPPAGRYRGARSAPDRLARGTWRASLYPVVGLVLGVVFITGLAMNLVGSRRAGTSSVDTPLPRSRRPLTYGLMSTRAVAPGGRLLYPLAAICAVQVGSFAHPHLEQHGLPG